MKYRQLTKEQLTELHQEFSQFLASQQIDVKEWEQIKKDKPEVAEEELNIFSEIVWEDVLSKTKFLEHISENYMNLFQCNSKEILRIMVKSSKSGFSFLNEENFNQFLQNPLAVQFEYFKASKKYSKERNQELFELIEMGAHISKGELFKQLVTLIS